MIINACRVCGEKDLYPVLDLGDQPWCNDYQVEDGSNSKTYPLATVFCPKCSTLQVKFTVPKEIMYSDHTYLSGANSSMPAHFYSIAEKCHRDFNQNANLVVDIGSNDGTLLNQFKKLNLKVLGVEPCTEASQKAIEIGVPTINDFFNSSQARSIKEEYGAADIISAANVFYHVEELHDIVIGVKHLLSNEGTFIVQGTYLPSLLENNEFDIIYHEHLLYYRIENLNYLLNMHGLEIFDVEFVAVHGGSFVAYIAHKGFRKQSPQVESAIKGERALELHTIKPYLAFADRVHQLKTNICNLLSSLKQEGNSIYAYGAPAKGTVMINFCGLDVDTISCAVEVNKEKIGTYVPGTSIKVLDEKTTLEPDYYFLLSWNFLDVFKKQPVFLEGIRKFIVPVPAVSIVTNRIEK